MQQGSRHSRQYFISLSIAALGVVFGDIGTSPLYALRECFYGPHAFPINHDNVYGVLSLITWSLILVVSIKYLLFVMRADNRGEGGVLALMALVAPRIDYENRKLRNGLVILGLFGAALLYGDGMITPAISVLSAVEGLSVAAPNSERYVIPLTCIILMLIFIPQNRGTQRIGIVFGPIILLWFLVIALLGIKGIIEHPEVLASLSPHYAILFFTHHGLHGFVILGAVFLVVTGGEALYADMGHFGRRPIQFAWFTVVLPSLLLNYLGQAALIIADPSTASNPFYLLAPQWALYPLVGIATLSAVIASQALISGAFSITRQAVQLGYLPRFEINHTSEHEIGQIYVPQINWLLMFSTLWLVLTFRTSSNLAAAYGLAVTATMGITTLLTHFVARERWKWNVAGITILTVFFLTIDLSFFAANALKIASGGWFPLAVGFVILTLMTTWRRGRYILASRLKSSSIALKDFMDSLENNPPLRVPGVGVFMTSSLYGIPPALIHNLKHNKILHEKVLFVMCTTDDVPHVSWENRYEVEAIDLGFYLVTVHYGFMDTPNIPAVLRRVGNGEGDFKLSEVTYYLGRETLIPSNKPGMAIWREKIFEVMSRNAQRATIYFKIPPDQVIEIGIQVEL